MAAVDDIIAEVSALAAARYAESPAAGGPVMIALGPPGTVVHIAGQPLDSGSAWGPDKVMQVLLDGVVTYYAQQGIGSIQAIEAKVNELVAAYGQLCADYNAGTVPTTAPAVLPL